MVIGNFDFEYGEHVIGIDETGYGSWAGPVCVAAVILHKDHNIQGIDDSKKLKPKKRDELFEQIKEKSYYCIVTKEPNIIDQINIWEATKLAMQDAVLGLNRIYDTILVDGNKNPNFCPKIKCIVNGDSFSPSIAAASILAKVYRDRLMLDYSNQYPDYGFDKHKGYGTALHRQSLVKHGLSPIHRMSYNIKL